MKRCCFFNSFINKGPKCTLIYEYFINLYFSLSKKTNFRVNLFHLDIFILNNHLYYSLKSFLDVFFQVIVSKKIPILIKIHYFRTLNFPKIALYAIIRKKINAHLLIFQYYRIFFSIKI
jgi:hypothetical protein